MKKTILFLILSLLFCNVSFAKWKVNKPYQVFITSDELAENIKFYKSSKNMSFCKKNRDDANDQFIKFSNNEQRRLIKETFNKTLTDWDTNDEYADVMNDFALATCKTMIYGNDKEKKELLEFIIELTKLEKFYSITPEWVMDHSGPYWFARNIPPFLFAWSYVRDLATKKQQKYMHKWINKLYKNLIKDDGCKKWKSNSCYGNHAYNVRNALILMAILLNDDKKFDLNVKAFFKILKTNVTKDALFTYELKRGHCSSHYHVHAFSPIFAILQNLKTQDYDYYNKELANGFEIKDILQAVLTEFLPYPKKYLKTVSDFYVTESCPTKGQKFVYKYEQADFLLTAQFGFISLYENNISDSNQIDFSNIKKLKIIWDKKITEGKKYFYEDYNENGKIDSLFLVEINARKNIYQNTWGDSIFGGFPIILNKIEIEDQ